MNNKYHIAQKLYSKTLKKADYIELKIPTITDYLNNKKHYRTLLLNYINHSLEHDKKIIKILNKSILYIYLKFLIFNF